MGKHWIARRRPDDGRFERLEGELEDATFYGLTEKWGLPPRHVAFHEGSTHVPTVLAFPRAHDNFAPVFAEKVLRVHAQQAKKEATTVTWNDWARIARWWAKRTGVRGGPTGRGGWLYTKDWQVVCHGYADFEQIAFREMDRDRSWMADYHLQGPKISAALNHLVNAYFREDL